jgi:hypothetical protein
MESDGDDPDPSPTTQGSETLLFDGVVITPFTELLDRPTGGSDHRGGPLWPDWTSQASARHCRRGAPVDEPPASVAPGARIDGEVAWGGPVVYHFGHQISDFSMRLVPTLTAHPDTRIAFATQRAWGWRSIADAPDFVHQILDWVGLPRERALLVTEPTLAVRLVVLPQAEQHKGPGPDPAHLDRMDELASGRLAGRRSTRSGLVFVSRAAMHARLAGEAYLEDVLRACGVTVMRPEALPLRRQLETYAASEALLFSQGSAVHALQLLGRQDVEVHVLLRIPGSRIAETSLRPRVRSLAYRDALAGVVCGLMAPGVPFTVLGIPVIDADRLLGHLTTLVPGIRQRWDRAAFEAARDADVLEWFARSVPSPRVRVPGSWEHMLGTLDASGLRHLRPAAERMVAAERARSVQGRGALP